MVQVVDLDNIAPVAVPPWASSRICQAEGCTGKPTVGCVLCKRLAVWPTHAGVECSACAANATQIALNGPPAPQPTFQTMGRQIYHKPARPLLFSVRVIEWHHFTEV